MNYRDDLWGAESQLRTDNQDADGSQGTAVIELHPAGGLASEWPASGPRQCGAPEAPKTLSEEDSNTTAPGICDSVTLNTQGSEPSPDVVTGQTWWLLLPPPPLEGALLLKSKWGGRISQLLEPLNGQSPRMSGL